MHPGVGERILQQARQLAFPRYPGTEGDRRAIAMVRERLESSGLETTVEAFSYDLGNVWRLLRAVLVGAAVALAISAWMATRLPVASLGVLLLAVVAAASLLAWSPWLERLYAASGSTSTANVCARRAVEAPVRTVILLAHHDSKSQNLTMLARGALTVVALVATAGIATAAFLAIGGGPAGVPPGLAPVAGGLGTLALLVLSTLRSGNESPGGVDNAGSLAILLELASALPSVVSEATELVFLSTGAEEDHMVGAMRWLDENEKALAGRPVVALNMDGVGSPGRLVLLERYGLGRPFAPELTRLARQVASDQGFTPRGVLMPPAMGIDAIPFANRGVPCLTLSSGSLGPATLSVHSRNDRADHLSAEVLEKAYTWALEIVRRLDTAG